MTLHFQYTVSVKDNGTKNASVRVSVGGVTTEIPIKVIPNTMPVETFSYNRKPNEDYHLPADVKVIAMGAARLDDAVKGFDLLIDTTRHIKQYRPEVAQKLHLLLFGDIRDASLLQKLAIPYTHLGRVSNDDVRDIMVHSDIVLSTSYLNSYSLYIFIGLL